MTNILNCVILSYFSPSHMKQVILARNPQANTFSSVRLDYGSCIVHVQSLLNVANVTEPCEFQASSRAQKRRAREPKCWSRKRRWIWSRSPYPTRVKRETMTTSRAGGTLRLSHGYLWTSICSSAWPASAPSTRLWRSWTWSRTLSLSTCTGSPDSFASSARRCLTHASGSSATWKSHTTCSRSPLLMWSNPKNLSRNNSLLNNWNTKLNTQ